VTYTIISINILVYILPYHLEKIFLEMERERERERDYF